MGTSHKRKAERKAMENRELSWLKFNSRIQDEADNPDNPLLERAKFLAIVTSNMDEFLQVRYERIYDGRYGEKKLMGQVTGEQLYRKVNKEILRQSNRQYMLYEGIRSELFMESVQLYPTFSMGSDMLVREKLLFEKEIRPYLKIEPLSGAHPRQKQLYLCVKLARSRRKAEQFQLIALPSSLPRLFDMSIERDVQRIIRLEDVVKHSVHSLFPRDEVEHCAVFRILRNQNFAVEEETTEDVVPAVRDMLTRRQSGRVMRLEAEERMSEEMLTLLMKQFELEQERRYRVTGPLDLNKLMMGLYGLLKRPDLKYTPAQPVELTQLMGEDVFEQIDRREWLM